MRCGVSALGQRHRVHEVGVRGATGSLWHTPRMHVRRLPEAQRRGRALHSDDAGARDGFFSCLEAPRLFCGVPLPPTGPLWAEECVYACDALNITARVRDKPDKLSPYQEFHGKASFPRLLPFLKPGFYHVKWTPKSEAKVQACFFLIGGSYHPSDCCKILLTSGRRSYTKDVTWKHPRKAFVGLLPAVWGGRTPPQPLP